MYDHIKENKVSDNQQDTSRETLDLFTKNVKKTTVQYLDGLENYAIRVAASMPPDKLPELMVNLQINTLKILELFIGNQASTINKIIRKGREEDNGK